MKLDKYLISGEINIPTKEWQELKKEYTKEELIEALNTLVEENNIEFFVRNLSEEDAFNDYQELLNFDTKKILISEEWFSKFEYRYPKTRGYIAKTSKGKNASNFFMQKERHKVGSHNKKSLFDAWNDEKSRTQTFRALFTLNRSHVNNSTILQTAECKHYLPSAFRPTAAKAIYDITKAQRILDMSSGWGDRLVASCGREYLGFDPNSSLTDKYKQIIKTYNLNAEVRCVPFEESVIPNNYFDVMFSSPPYFQCEQYAKEETQSCMRYLTIESWLNNFLFKSIDIIYDSLITGGYLVLNISDINIKSKRQYICDKMNDYIKDKKMKYIGCIGLQLSKLPNTTENSGIFGEPVWIWKKE